VDELLRSHESFLSGRGRSRTQYEPAGRKLATATGPASPWPGTSAGVRSSHRRVSCHQQEGE
jgi:hypothetical protein